jgi:hypothetical protein
MSEPKYICIRDTYVYNRLWKAGEALWDGLEPTKHFTLNGVLPKDQPAIPMGPFDDPRPTPKLKADCEDLGIETKGRDRKALWSAWAEKVKESSPKPEKSTIKVDVDGILSNNPLLKKNFSDMTPDDINNITAKEMCEKLKREPYLREDAKPAGTTKANLVALGIRIEQERHMSSVG